MRQDIFHVAVATNGYLHCDGEKNNSSINCSESFKLNIMQ